jgi:tRNA (guanine26-N2/guanine27-N2)-dimethyltransferase
LNSTKVSLDAKSDTTWLRTMITQTIIEGITKLEVPELAQFRTPAGDYAPSLTEVFYNPIMELSRDISVSALQVIADELGSIRVCDPLAGVGARGLRYAKEVREIAKVVVNDRSREAVELIRRNVELNELSSSIEALNEDANVLLRGYRPRFQAVDIDPFGSPAPFTDSACAVLSRNGFLMLTATDTAPLSGNQPKACIRRYGAKPLRTEYCHELGIRILIGFCQRVAGMHEIALSPLLAHSTRHYFRVYMKAVMGAKRADEIMAQHGYVSQCNACGRRMISFGIAVDLPIKCECGEKLGHAGPIWLGRIMDKGFIQRVMSDLSKRNFRLGQEELVLLSRCLEESEGPPTYYEISEVARMAGVQPPKILKVISRLRSRGYFASRTHFSGTGLRTDAPLDEIISALK